jgi:hypothetical protein
LKDPLIVFITAKTTNFGSKNNDMLKREKDLAVALAGRFSGNLSEQM